MITGGLFGSSFIFSCIKLKDKTLTLLHCVPIRVNLNTIYVLHEITIFLMHLPFITHKLYTHASSTFILIDCLLRKSIHMVISLTNNLLEVTTLDESIVEREDGPYLRLGYS